ncbi:MAG: hypothetical protein KDJ41_19600 [Hyphomicrobiaceae bacterium]|nr:hypothetical protein [Hyphomicrobiaceae bacterium]
MLGSRMDLLQSFAEWAWARHHNPWSWYVRPLFLLPFCWCAWRRSPAGLALTLLALLTSMFWFPAPATPDPRTVAFLEAERRFLLAPWTVSKVAMTATVPVFLAAVAAAFWWRSVLLGLAVVNAGTLFKIAWSFAYGGESGWTVVPPALAGLVVVNVAVLLLARWRQVPR